MELESSEMRLEREAALSLGVLCSGVFSRLAMHVNMVTVLSR